MAAKGRSRLRPGRPALASAPEAYVAAVGVARDIVGEGFRISFPELESFFYWEGEDGFLFHGGWGVTPPVIEVPSAEVWAEVMPAWSQRKRDVVIARFQEHAGHDVREGDDADWQYRRDPHRRILRSSG